MSAIVIVDSGIANLASVRAAFGRLGATTRTTCDPAEIRRAQRIVLPGVGAFGPGVAALRSRGLDAAIVDSAETGTPILGICLGLQLLCEASEESPGVPGLGLIPGECRRLPDTVPVPHLGWNFVEPDTSCRFLAPMHAAFANSYALFDAPADSAAAWSAHGVPFIAGIEYGSILGCQFHPELSGNAGHDLLRRWLGSRAAHAGLTVRLVPCLDVRDGRVVKGVRFTGLRDAGDPAECAARYEAQGADEIVLLDIAASVEARRTTIETVRAVRAVLGISLTVGGGVRTIEDARRLLAAGADKVSINSAAVVSPERLKELAREFGSQCVVLAIDARRRGTGWEVLVNGGRDRTGLDAIEWARTGTAFGAGEVLLTSWDRDGTRLGCDLPLLRAVSAGVGVPIIASGGIGTSEHAADAVDAGAHAVLAASIFHDSLATVAGIKADLTARGVRVRP